MKKIILCVLCVLCVFMMCGCRDTRSVISENGRFLVSAIGIDQKNENILVSVEAVVINAQDSEEPPKTEIFENLSKNFDIALKEIIYKSAKPLDFSHCAMIIFGETLKDEGKNAVYEFCSKNEQITVSVGFAQTSNANALLKLKPLSEITVGYEMAVMLETVFVENKTAFSNRFFEIENTRLKGEKLKPLPRFLIEEKSFYLEGEKD